MSFAPAMLDGRPFGLPAESIEIIIDLPFPPSTNRLHAYRRVHVYSTKEYIAWQKACDATILFNRQYPREKITGPFEIEILLDDLHKGDGDNRIKATLDLLQSREIIRDDRDCRKGRWEWVSHDRAPLGCRVHLRSLHG